METTIEFLLKTSLVWGLGLVCYLLFMRRQHRFTANRWFLLLLLLVVPLLFCLPAWRTIEEKIYLYNLAGIAVSAGSQAIAQPLQQHWVLWLILLLAGIGVGGLRLLLGWLQLRALLNKAHRQPYQHYTLLRLPQSADCYTFFGYIVVGDQIQEDDLPCVVAHEAAHRQMGHSRDILLAEVVAIFFWFHPFVYLFKLLLRELHEFQADQAVLRHYSVRNYGDLLLQRAMNTRVSLFHTFSHHSQLKNRLKMMTQLNKNGRFASLMYWAAVPVLLFAFLLLNVQTVQAQVTDQPDVMPTYGNCQTSTGDAKQTCSMQNLMTALANQIKYPESAKNAKVEGKVYVEFIVSKQGKVRDAKVVKSVETALDAEALRAVNALKDWTAGEKGGKKVDVKMVLPIFFKL